MNVGNSRAVCIVKILRDNRKIKAKTELAQLVGPKSGRNLIHRIQRFPVQGIQVGVDHTVEIMLGDLLHLERIAGKCGKPCMYKYKTQYAQDEERRLIHGSVSFL